MTVTIDDLEIDLCSALAGASVSVVRGEWVPYPGTTDYWTRRTTITIDPPVDSCVCGYDGLSFGSVESQASYSTGRASQTYDYFPGRKQLVSEDGRTLWYEDIKLDWCVEAAQIYCQEYGTETIAVTKIGVCCNYQRLRRATIQLTCSPVGSGTAAGGGSFTCVDADASFGIVPTPSVGWRFSRAYKRVPVGDASVDGPFTTLPISIPVAPLLDCVLDYNPNPHEYYVEFTREYNNKILVDDSNRLLLSDVPQSGDFAPTPGRAFKIFRYA